MYVINQRLQRKKTIIKYLVLSSLLLVIIGLVIWLVFFRSHDNSTNFQSNTSPAIVKPQMRDFENEYFKISLPTTWTELGRQNPFAYEVYYEFQNTQKDYDNRWLRVYVDVIPDNQAITKVLPVTVVDNRLVPGTISSACRTFNGAPLSSGSQATMQAWIANWQGIDFYCDLNPAENFTGTASQDEGYKVTLNNQDGSQHRYFIAYIDHNNDPDDNFLIDVVNTFETR